MKKIINILVAISLVFAMAIPVFASGASQTAPSQLSSYWPAFRGAEAFKGLTDAKTPTTTAETELKWSYNTGGNFMSAPGFPIEVGEFVYYAFKSNVIKLNKETGALLKTSPNAVAAAGFFSTIAYGDGKIFMPIAGGRIQAFDAETLDSLWVSQVCPLSSMQSNSPVTYHDGYIYMGVSNSNATSGTFFCLSTEDEYITTTNEIKNYTWSYTPAGAGFYWSEGVAVGENIIFAGEDGILVSHHLTNDVVTSTFTLTKNNGSAAEAVRSSTHYDKENGRVYVSTKAGSIHSIKLNANGTFDSASYLSKFLANDLTSSPATYKGRLYLGGGGVSSAAGVSVLNAETLDIIYQISGIGSQSSPIISTAYATVENNWKVYIYLLQYTGTSTNKDRIYCLTDEQGQTTSNYTELAQSPNPQYNSSSLAVGKDGTLYYKNDSGYLFAFKNTNGAYTATDMINAINRMPALNKLTSKDEPLLALTEERMAELASEVQENVTNASALTAARNRMTEITDSAAIIPSLIADIEALPAIDSLKLADNSTVQGLLTTYFQLPELDKPFVTNIDILLAAQTKLIELSDAKKVADVKDAIEALPVKASMSSKAVIENTLIAYNELPSELQASVSNAAVLHGMVNQLLALETEITAINDAIWALNPENITLTDKASVESIIARYNQLSEGDRVYVEYFDEVLGFKAIIDTLESGVLPEGTELSVTNSTNPLDSSSPKTGDDSNLAVWIFTGMAALAVLVLLARRKKEQSL